MTNFDFLDPLEDIIIEQFSVLDADYSRDMVGELLPTLTAAIESEHEIRFVLIDGETGQLESRRLFEEYQQALDAMKDKNLTHCLIGTLLVEGL